MLKKTAKDISPQLMNPIRIYPGLVLNPFETDEEKKFKVTKVFYRTEDYAIFEVNDNGCLEYITVNDKIYNTRSISLQLNRIEYWVAGSILDGNTASFIETMADAIALSFDKRNDEALATITSLEALIKNQIYEASKLLYIFPYLVIIAVMVILSIMGQLDYFRALVPADLRHFLNISLFGTMGCALSVSRNLDQYKVEVKQSKNFLESAFGKHMIGVTFRVTVAILSAISIYVIYNSKLINPEIQGENKNVFILYSLALVAGISENLIPSLLTRFESDNMKGELIRVNSKSVVNTNDVNAPTSTPQEVKPKQEEVQPQNIPNSDIPAVG